MGGNRPIAAVRRKRLRHALPAAALAALVACAPAMAPRADAGLGDTSWLVEGLTPDDAADSVRRTMVFGNDDQITGEGGCNRFFGTYRTDGASLTIGPLGSTRMACPGPVMDRETQFFNALEAVAAWQSDGSDVLLLDGDGQPLVRLTPLTDQP